MAIDQSTFDAVHAAAARFLSRWDQRLDIDDVAHDATVLTLLRYPDRSLIDQKAIARTIARRQAFRSGRIRDRVRRVHDTWIEARLSAPAAPAAEDAMVAEGLGDYAAAVDVIRASGKQYAAAVDPTVVAGAGKLRRKAVYRGMKALRRIMLPHTTTFDDDVT